MPILYKHRVVESELRLRLASAGAIVIEGPKACGKTATAETLAASVVLLDVDEQARRAADVDLPPSAIPIFKLGIHPWIDQPCAVAEA